jgi:hypothetical protein
MTTAAAFQHHAAGVNTKSAMLAAPVRAADGAACSKDNDCVNSCVNNVCASVDPATCSDAVLSCTSEEQTITVETCTKHRGQTTCETTTQTIPAGSTEIGQACADLNGECGGEVTINEDCSATVTEELTCTVGGFNLFTCSNELFVAALAAEGIVCSTVFP